MIEELREQIRAYLRNRNHEMNQDELAKAIGVSVSWLNKFLNGQFDDLRVGRLQRLADWVEQDRLSRMPDAERQFNRINDAVN